jgi:hypothetical protein
MTSTVDSLRWNLYRVTNARTGTIEEIIDVVKQHLIDIGCDDAAALLSDPTEKKQAKPTRNPDEFFNKNLKVYDT